MEQDPFSDTSPSPKLFKLSVYDDKHFAVKFYELSAEQFTHVHTLVEGFPERRYRRAVQAWIIPFAQATFDYLYDRFTPEEYDLDAEAKLVLDYHEATDKSLKLREQRRWKYVFENEAPEVDFSFHTKPFKHQTVALDALHNAEYFGLLMEMGTGKTKVVIDELRWCAEERMAKGKGALKVLIVCPKSIRGTWKREIGKHLPDDFEYWVKLCRSSLRLLEDFMEGIQADQPLKIWLINFDRLRTNIEPLTKMGFDITILDESSRIKAPSAKRSKAARAIGEASERRIIMTGTPIGNSVMDVWSQFQFLQPGVLGYDTFSGFKRRYAEVKKVDKWDKIVGSANVDELKERMARCSFIVKKEDCLDLPPKIYTTRAVEMGDRQRLVYDEMLENFIASLTDDFSPQGATRATIVLTKLLRLSQICSGFIKPEDGKEIPIPGGAVKLEALGEVIDEIPPNEKIMIWSRFKYDIVQIREFFESRDIKSVEIHGGVKEADRTLAEERFNLDPTIRGFIGEPSSGGEGLTLIGSKEMPCTNAIYYSNDFSLLKRLQSEARPHRIGTFKAVTYTDIVCENSVDETIANRLQGKKNLDAMMKDYESIRELLTGTLHKEN